MNFSHKKALFFFMFSTCLSPVFATNGKVCSSVDYKAFSSDNKEYAEKMGKQLALLREDLLTVAEDANERKKIDFYLNNKRVQSYITTALSWHDLTIKYAQELEKAASGELKIHVDNSQKILSEVKAFLQGNDKQYKENSYLFAFQKYNAKELPTFFSTLHEITKQCAVEMPDIEFIPACEECTREGTLCDSGANMNNHTTLQITDHYLADCYDDEIKGLLAHELSHSQLNTCIDDRTFLVELLERLTPSGCFSFFCCFSNKRTWTIDDDCICFFLRAMEREADINALKITNNPAAFVHFTQRCLTKFRDDTPPCKNDHPTDFERIAYGLSLMEQVKTKTDDVIETKEAVETKKVA